jgi:hypothetical protein
MRVRAAVLALLLAGCAGGASATKAEVAPDAPSPKLQRCYEVAELPRIAQAWGEADATVAAFLSFEEEHAGCEPLLVPADKPQAEAAVLRAGLGLQRLQMYRLASQAYFSEQQMEQTCSTLQRGLLIGEQLRPLFEAARKVDEATLPESMRGLGEKVAQEANRTAGFFVFAQGTHCASSGSGE